MNNIKTSTTQKEKKYTKLLNNLLSIKGRDASLFTKVNGIDFFDITTKFGLLHSKKILSQKEFTLNMDETDLKDLLKIIQQATKGIDVITAYAAYKERLFNTKKILLEDEATFSETRDQLVEELQQKIQKTKNRWIQFWRKNIDANIQDNIWQLHVATMFVSIQTFNKTIYAPLLLKEVHIKVDDSKITLKSEDNWKINEKLIFIINENGFYVDEKTNLENLNGYEAISLLAKQINIHIDQSILSASFKNLNREEIKNSYFISHPGVVLGMFKPSGGHLRKTMMQIIEEGIVDEILDPNPDKSIYKDAVDDFIKHKSHELIKIQKSNYSQDKALISAILQDTVIWGPPGTGKSQVIANLIANILYQEKTAVVMSQKKAALDVLKKRLGIISPFVLFILNDNKLIKSEFYRPLQKFVEIIEYNTYKSYAKSKNNTQIVSNHEINMLRIISYAKNNKMYYPSLNLINIYKHNFNYVDKIFQLKHTYKYPEQSSNWKIYRAQLADLNQIKQKQFLFFKKYPKHLKQLSMDALAVIAHLENHNINHVVDFARSTNIKLLQALFHIAQNSQPRNTFQSDEEYLVSFLSNNIRQKIKLWEKYDREKVREYLKFARAVRAGNRLPYKFINDHISIIRQLFPIIVTTPETTFVNWERNSFDYAILDESSQMFLEIGLPILYLAQTKVLAGDSQQMQPSRWFTTRDDEDTEEDVAENAESVLDYAMDKGTYAIMLNQNFRSSHAALMAFSSKEFYKSKLEVIDKNGRYFSQKMRSKTPAIVVENVNGKWDQGINIAEAEKVIQIILQECKNFEKIIILTFNSYQRQYIEKIIIEQEPKLFGLLESEKLALKNIENIQGDEANLVVASVVYDPTTNIGSTYVARAGGKNALNVAISRAIDKMIVIKSLNAQNIKMSNTPDFQVFRDWLTFLDKTETEQRHYSYNVTESHGETDSDFERDVIETIKSNLRTYKKLKLIKQYEVGSKKIDVAFVDDDNQYVLGVEVDGYNYHDGLGFDKYLEDLSRQELLESKGYNIYRIKEIDWRIRKEKILQEISNILNK